MAKKPQIGNSAAAHAQLVAVITLGVDWSRKACARP